MSKEQTFATQCSGCGNMITFFDYHLDHCPNAKVVELPKKKKKGKKR